MIRKCKERREEKEERRGKERKGKERVAEEMKRNIFFEEKKYFF